MVRIKIYLEDSNLQIAERDWSQIPRQGETIQLYGAEYGGTFLITEVHWCGDSEQQVLMTIKPAS